MPKQKKYFLVDRGKIINQVDMTPQKAGKSNAGFHARGETRRWVTNCESHSAEEQTAARTGLDDGPALPRRTPTPEDRRQRRGDGRFPAPINCSNCGNPFHGLTPCPPPARGFATHFKKNPAPLKLEPLHVGMRHGQNPNHIYAYNGHDQHHDQVIAMVYGIPLHTRLEEVTGAEGLPMAYMLAASTMQHELLLAILADESLFNPGEEEFPALKAWAEKYGVRIPDSIWGNAVRAAIEATIARARGQELAVTK